MSAIPAAAWSSNLLVEVRRVARSWDTPQGRELCLAIEELTAALPPETVIHSRRNTLFRVSLDGAAGRDVVIKRLPVRQPIRRLIYTVRSSKALRSFDNASRLLELGVHTPEPLAAVEVWRRGLLTVSYYCCLWQDHWVLAKQLKTSTDPRSERATRALGEFVAHLHNLGVLHGDLSSGNVLLRQDPENPSGIIFSLVDLNRVRFHAVGRRMGLANLALLGTFPHTAALLEGYCTGRGLTAKWAGLWYRALLGVQRLRLRVKSSTRQLRRKVGL